MGRLRTALLVAASVVAGAAAAAPASAATTQTYRPPFLAGPHGGDQFNIVNQDPKSGRVSVVRAYPQPGAFNCAGTGGYADLLVKPTLQAATSAVTVSYANSAWDSYAWLTVLVRDSAGNWLGGRKLRGPVAGSGSLTVPIVSTAAGTPISVQFGIEVASACPNADGGSIQFSAVAMSGSPASGKPPLVPGLPKPPKVPSPPPGVVVPSAFITAVNFQFIPGDDDFASTVKLRVPEGDGLVFVGGDVLAPHTVTADLKGPDGLPIFDSGDPAAVGQVAPVVGVADLPPGRYRFHCRVHTQMTGTLVVLAPLPVESVQRPAW